MKFQVHIMFCFTNFYCIIIIVFILMIKISRICIFLVDSKHQTMSGLSFPMTAAVRDAIINYKNQKTNYVQLSINISKEIIELEDQTSCDSKSLPSRVPEGAPRYHLFRFDHTHEGDYLKSTSNLMFRNFCMYYMCIYFKIQIYDFYFSLYLYHAWL